MIVIYEIGDVVAINTEIDSSYCAFSCGWAINHCRNFYKNQLFEITEIIKDRRCKSNRKYILKPLYKFIPFPKEYYTSNLGDIPWASKYFKDDGIFRKVLGLIKII